MYSGRDYHEEMDMREVGGERGRGGVVVGAGVGIVAGGTEAAAAVVLPAGEDGRGGGTGGVVVGGVVVGAG